ncbi:hypothetical protein HanIR_Chr04g0165741 [Helianthus annuus]|nr:hypothetical protein HanIR_Chr04g0165741 [Helianthus annuus]
MVSKLSTCHTLNNTLYHRQRNFLLYNLILYGFVTINFCKYMSAFFLIYLQKRRTDKVTVIAMNREITL